ncbi:MAG: hypothetical protein LBD30_04520 [Verrucomicrobiales bacterium]|jgi:hypothetical protein|nr:hypothetical protein [Verrucomicrobiales bacterium]
MSTAAKQAEESTRDEGDPVEPGTPPPIIKERIKHPTPHWWPGSTEGRLAMGQRAYDAIISVGNQLKYGIDNNTVAHIKGTLERTRTLIAYQSALQALRESYTDMKDLMLNAGKDEKIVINKLDANATNTLGPATDLTCWGGILGWLMELERLLKLSPEYNKDQSFGIQAGFIKDTNIVPPNNFVVKIKQLVCDGAELIARVPFRAPVTDWVIYLDKRDGAGWVYSDRSEHVWHSWMLPFPAQKTVWDAKVVFRRDGVEIGEPAITTVTVWQA